MKQITTSITPETKIIHIGITTRHLLETTDFSDGTSCALARAVAEQLGVVPRVTYISISFDGKYWKITSSQYSFTKFLADLMLAERSDDPEKIIRIVTAHYDESIRI